MATEDSESAEGLLLGLAEDNDGNRIYWYSFDGIHYGFGSLWGDDQGSSDDGDITLDALKQFHRGGIMHGDSESPYH